MKNERTLWDAHAIRWAEHLVTVGKNDAAARLLRGVANGIDDEGALAEAVEPTGATLGDVYALMDATLFRCGRRITLPSNPCNKSWDQERPCLRASGHASACESVDTNTAHQRKVHAQLLAEMGAYAAAVVGCAR